MAGICGTWVRWSRVNFHLLAWSLDRPDLGNHRALLRPLAPAGHFFKTARCDLRGRYPDVSAPSRRDFGTSFRQRQRVGGGAHSVEQLLLLVAGLLAAMYRICAADRRRVPVSSTV